MDIAVSPYHLTTSEPPALAALLLGRRVVTFMPAPFEGSGRSEVIGATERAPRFLRLMEAWRWTMPLWRAGVLTSSSGGADVGPEVRAAWEAAWRGEEWARLRPLMRRNLYDDSAEYLDEVSADLLKGGPAPGVNIPITAGLDRFAAAHGLLVARADPTSVTQRAEATLGRRVVAVGVPVLVEASAERLLLARAALEGPLGALRAAFGAAMGVSAGRGAAEEVVEAAGAYAAAFGDVLPRLVAEDRAGGARTVAAYVSLTGTMLPADAVLRASVAALRSLGAGPSRGPAPGPVESLVPTLIVKRMNIRPDTLRPGGTAAPGRAGSSVA